MANRLPTTIPEYIAAAPSAGRPHLREIYAILKSVAPQAEEAIKWKTPFFVEPRFLFGFSGHKAHLNFAPTAAAMKAFRNELGNYEATKGMLKIRYDQPMPKQLIRRIAHYCVRELRERQSDTFW